MMETDNVIFFWGSVFSNFYYVDGDATRTSEKIFMLHKALVFEDFESYQKIYESKSPMAAKRLGRQVKNFDQDLWDNCKYYYMLNALVWKFKHCKEFREALKNSENKLIVEASPYDRIWGIGFDENNAIGNENLWGKNLLGKALMDIRTRL